MLEIIERAFRPIFPSFCLVCRRPLGKGLLCWGCMPATISTKERCSVCFEPISDEDCGSICLICTHYPRLIWSRRFIWEYDYKARLAVKVMKYNEHPRLATMLGNILATNLTNLFSNPSWDIILPIPASQLSLRKRSFNQALLIAREVSKATNIRLDAFALKRTQDRPSQVEIAPSRRWKNAKEDFAFEAKDNTGIKRILLIDDVSTSGATAHHAAWAIKSRLDCKIDFLSLARSKNWVQFRHNEI